MSPTPISQRLQATVPGVAAAVVQDQVAGEAEVAGFVTSVKYTPEAAITGTATNFRTLRLVNKGQSGVGTTVIAFLALDSGAVTAVAFDERDIPLGVEANRIVAAGDVLAWDETVTGTGLASPGGRVEVELAREGTPVTA